jgi:hypothetical protein
MSETDQLKHEILNLINELDAAKPDDQAIDLVIIDLIVSACDFSLSKWARTLPVKDNIGVLLLEIELKCVKALAKIPTPTLTPENMKVSNV